MTKVIGTPGNVVPTLVKILGLKNAAELARRMGIEQPVLSKIRSGKLPVNATFILNVHEVFGLAVSDIRRISNTPRKQYFSAKKQ